MLINIKVLVVRKQ